MPRVTLLLNQETVRERAFQNRRQVKELLIAISGDQRRCSGTLLTFGIQSQCIELAAAAASHCSDNYYPTNSLQSGGSSQKKETGFERKVAMRGRAKTQVTRN